MLNTKTRKSRKCLRSFSSDERKSLNCSGLPSRNLFSSFLQLIQKRRVKLERLPAFPNFRILHKGKFENLEKFFQVSFMKETVHSVLVTCLIATVSMLLATDSKQKSKVKKISPLLFKWNHCH